MKNQGIGCQNLMGYGYADYSCANRKSMAQTLKEANKHRTKFDREYDQTYFDLVKDTTASYANYFKSNTDYRPLTLYKF